MKNTVKALFCAVLMGVAAGAFAASKKSIVCVTYPEYDWVMNILGDRASKFDVTLLQNNGTDLHSYQPSVKDLAKVSSCDMLVFVGGESDEWVEDAIKTAKNKNMVVVNMVEALGDKVLEEEIVEGMEHHHHDEEDHDAHGHEEHDHDHDAHGHDHDDHDHEGEAHEHHHEKDEHVWLSVKFAIELTKVLSEKIQSLDSANAAAYKANTDAYVKQLSALDGEIESVVKAAPKKTILFGDRFPFRYFADDYKLTYYGAFAGCSAESEASFETIIFLANKVDEEGLKAVLTIEKSDEKIAKTIIKNTKSKNQEILAMDSLQSITKKDIKKGRNYLSAMQANLEVLKKALR